MLILRQKSFQFCTPCLKTPQPVLPYLAKTLSTFSFFPSWAWAICDVKSLFRENPTLQIEHLKGVFPWTKLICSATLLFLEKLLEQIVHLNSCFGFATWTDTFFSWCTEIFLRLRFKLFLSWILGFCSSWFDDFLVSRTNLKVTHVVAYLYINKVLRGYGKSKLVH